MRSARPLADRVSFGYAVTSDKCQHPICELDRPPHRGGFELARIVHFLAFPTRLIRVHHEPAPSRSCIVGTVVVYCLIRFCKHGYSTCVSTQYLRHAKPWCR